MKIGIFGGTFNPIHLGHLVLAGECWHKLSLDEVIFVPSYLPPHKGIDGGVLVHDRLNMVRLALEGDNRYKISTFEIDKGGKSYTIDTVKYFKSRYRAEDELFFICGSDAVRDLSKWKDADELFKYVKIAYVERGNHFPEDKYAERMIKLEMPSLEVSSTIIRDRIRKKEPIDHLLSAEVVKYIRNKGLYRE